MSPESPERAAVFAASAAWHEAGKSRAALGGYVPLNHPGHPSRWSSERQDVLAEADAEVNRTSAVMRAAMQALGEGSGPDPAQD
jgi:hypothetical protein